MMKRLLLAVCLCLTWIGSAEAIDVQIDSFEAATNTVVTSVFFFGIGPNPAEESDTGLPGVIGGSRAITVFSADFFLEAGVIPTSGVFDYMSIGTGFAAMAYDGGGGPQLMRAMSCSEAIEIDYQDADAPAISGVTIGIVLTDGNSVASAPVLQPLVGPAGTLSFPLSDFSGVDLDNIVEVGITINGDDPAPASESPDLALSEIRAVNCNVTDTPAPAMGAIALTMATVMLVGLGYLGFRRRFT